MYFSVFYHATQEKIIIRKQILDIRVWRKKRKKEGSNHNVLNSEEKVWWVLVVSLDLH